MKQWIIDSGAQTHVVRFVVAELFLGTLRPSCDIEFRGAGGHQLDFYDTVEILMIMNNRKFILRAEIADVKRNLLSVSKLEDHDYAVLFSLKDSRVQREDWHAKIHRNQALYQIEGDIVAMRLVSSTGGPDEVMPVEEEEREPPDDEGAASSHQLPPTRAIREVPEPHLPDPADQ